MVQQQSKPSRGVVRNTKIIVQYDFQSEKQRQWARKMNAKLTSKNFELIEYEPGRVVYKKIKQLVPLEGPNEN